MPQLKETSNTSVLYVLRELGRRAGADQDWIAQWRVKFTPGCVSLFPDPSSQAVIRFSFDPAKSPRRRELIRSSSNRYSWPTPPSQHVLQLLPDFVVNFEERASSGPLFQVEGSQSVTFRADVLTATLWTLSRAEEKDAVALDEHGRFSAPASIAYQNGFLERPIVDEYGLALRQALCTVVPGWKPMPPMLRAKISHDMDLLGIPRSLRTIAGHLYPRRRPDAFVQDMCSALGFGSTAYLRAVVDLAEMSRRRGLDSAFYWTASTRTTRWDAGYDLNHPAIRKTIEIFLDDGIEIGLHPAYETFGSQSRLDDELSRLRRYVGDRPIGGRQHYLRWNPSTWKSWETAGLAYDSSVGFADAIGYRAGTATPYHPWLLDDDRESGLLEIPLLVMDCTPIAYMRLGKDDALARISSIIDRCRLLGGVFTLLWHNTSIVEQPYRNLYPRILDLLSGTAMYDWRQDLRIASVPRVMGSTALTN